MTKPTVESNGASANRQVDETLNARGPDDGSPAMQSHVADENLEQEALMSPEMNQPKNKNRKRKCLASVQVQSDSMDTGNQGSSSEVQEPKAKRHQKAESDQPDREPSINNQQVDSNLEEEALMSPETRNPKKQKKSQKNLAVVPVEHAPINADNGESSRVARGSLAKKHQSKAHGQIKGKPPMVNSTVDDNLEEEALISPEINCPKNQKSLTVQVQSGSTKADRGERSTMIHKSQAKKPQRKAQGRVTRAQVLNNSTVDENLEEETLLSPEQISEQQEKKQKSSTKVEEQTDSMNAENRGSSRAARKTAIKSPSRQAQAQVQRAQSPNNAVADDNIEEEALLSPFEPAKPPRRKPIKKPSQKAQAQIRRAKALINDAKKSSKNQKRNQKKSIIVESSSSESDESPVKSRNRCSQDKKEDSGEDSDDYPEFVSSGLTFYDHDDDSREYLFRELNKNFNKASGLEPWRRSHKVKFTISRVLTYDEEEAATDVANRKSIEVFLDNPKKKVTTSDGESCIANPFEPAASSTPIKVKALENETVAVYFEKKTQVVDPCIEEQAMEKYFAGKSTALELSAQ